MSQLRICHALWDRSDTFDEDSIKSLLLDCNFTLDSILMPMVDSDVNGIISWAADETNYTHVVVYDTGTCLTNPDGMRTAWYELAKTDWSIAGMPHLNGMHSSIFGINLDAWSRLGRPLIADDRISDTVGQRLIRASHAAGVSSTTLTPEITRSKIYIYPHHNTTELLRMVSSAREGHKIDADHLGNADQIKFVNMISWASGSNDKGAIFVYNTGDKLVNLEAFGNDRFDCIWGTASGFKLFAEWAMRGRDPTCEIYTYDYNNRSLSLWESITRDWDGHDLYSFVKARHDDCDTQPWCWGNIQDYETPSLASARQEQELCDMLGGRESMLEAWASYKALKHTFISCDITRSYESLIKWMDPSKAHVIWLNNVFYYGKSIRKYGVNFLCSQFFDFMHQLNASVQRCHAHGQIAGMYFAEPVSWILERLRDDPRPQYQCHIPHQDPSFTRLPGHPFLLA